MAEALFHRSWQRRGESPEFEGTPPLQRRCLEHIDLVETQSIDMSVSPASEPDIDLVAPALESGGTTLITPSIEVPSSSGGDFPPHIVEDISEGPLPPFNSPLTRAFYPVILQVRGLFPSPDTIPLFDYIRMASLARQSSSGGQPTVTLAGSTLVPVNTSLGGVMPPNLTPPVSIPSPFMHPNAITQPNLFGVGVAGLSIPSVSVPLPTAAAPIGVSGSAHVNFSGRSIPTTPTPPIQPNLFSIGPFIGGIDMPGSTP